MGTAFLCPLNTLFMQVKLVTLSAIMLGTMACSKSNDKPVQAVSELRLSIHYETGGIFSETLNDDALARNSFLQYSVNDDGKVPLLNIGAVTTNINTVPFGISFAFKDAADFTAVSGIYNFPASNELIRTALRIETGDDNTVIHLLPSAGRLVLNYNASDKTISGQIENLEFPQDEFDDPTITKKVLNGTFRSVREK